MQNRNIITLSFLGIVLMLIGALAFNYLSSKGKYLTQKEKFSMAIDSIRASVIDSMQQVIQSQEKKSTPVIPNKPTLPIELYDLINLFTPQENLNYNLYNWKTEANNPSINWLTNGIASDSDGFYREGNVVVSIHKNVIKCLDRNSYPCEWGIILLGSHGGYTSFEISSVQSQALEKMDINELFKGHKFEAKILKTDEFNNKTYQVKFPQKKPIEMAIKWSCGSGGCSLSLKCETHES